MFPQIISFNIYIGYDLIIYADICNHCISFVAILESKVSREGQKFIFDSHKNTIKTYWHNLWGGKKTCEEKMDFNDIYFKNIYILDNKMVIRVLKKKR